MKKSLLLTDSLKGNWGFLCYKFQFLFVFFSVFFSAQDLQIAPSSAPAEPLIVVVNGASVYSNDAAFNRQISNNKTLQKYSEVITSDDGKKVKIIPKSSRKSKEDSKPAKKQKNLKVAVKKVETKKNAVKPIDILICKTSDDQFVLLSISSGGYFITTTNDFNRLAPLIFAFRDLENNSKLLVVDNDYFHKNNNHIIQVFNLSVAVRPPPNLS